MTYRSWPIFLFVLMLMPLSGGIAYAQKRDDTARKHSSDCFWKQSRFERTLGTLRQFPDAELRFALAHKTGAKPDYPVCFNRRERLRRDIQIDQWRQNDAPECLSYFRSKDAQNAKEWKARGLPPRQTLQQRIAEYNEDCLQTTAGSL